MSFHICFEQYPDLARAYTCPAVVLGVFRHLSHQAQSIIMCLLFIQQLNYQSIHDLSPTFDLKQLLSKQILLKDQGYSLNKTFRQVILQSLSHPIVSSLRPKRKHDKRAPTKQQILRVCSRNWQKLIVFLIGLGDRPSQTAMNLLQNARLVSRSSQSTGRTAACFKFLLQPREIQQEQLLTQILADSYNRISTVEFLYNLSVAEFFVGYVSKNIQADKVNILVQLGLLYRYNSKSKRVYLSQYMIGLLTDTQQGNFKTNKFLVVQTNFRVYAYTSQDIYIVLLSYFLELEYRLPNLVIASLTRKGVIQAFKSGIQAQQITKFLYNHSLHRVPENVIDQIKLWEKQRQRITSYSSIMLQEFIEMPLYYSTLNYAKETGAYIWDNPDRRVIIIKKQKADPVIAYLRNLDRL